MVKYFLTIFLVLFLTTLCPGQNRQIAPLFPGGVSELKKELYSNLNRKSKGEKISYPVSFRLNFSVDKRGKAFNASIYGIDDPVLMKRVSKAVKKLSRFKPGRANGEPIRCDVSIELDLK
ncbi:MAG: hypothetical protein H6Q22_1186 [Bacteroidetes bacterium]|nr:hypothetical protein [Bacteroidota bacterium]